MSVKSIKNMAASVRERLLQQARKDKRPFNELLQYAAMDRFLYRWSKSKSANHFVLKGALMLRVWNISEQRATRDIDMLAKNVSNELESIAAIITEVMAVDIESDGFVFSPETIAVTRITEDADYEGVRVKFIGNLDSAKVSMQIDIGFRIELFDNAWAFVLSLLIAVGFALLTVSFQTIKAALANPVDQLRSQ